MKMGFDHWLGNVQLPEAAEENFIMSIYPALRMGDTDAKRLVIGRHIRLTFGIVRYFAAGYSDTDELVAEGLMALVHGIELIVGGALDHHVPQPNVGGYLNRTISGALNKLVTRRRGVNEKTYRKYGGKTPRIILSDSESWVRAGKDVLETLEQEETLIVLTSKLKTFKESEVLRLRLEGHTDREISFRLGVTEAAVWKIRQTLKERLEKLV